MICNKGTHLELLHVDHEAQTTIKMAIHEIKLLTMQMFLKLRRQHGMLSLTRDIEEGALTVV